MIMKRDSPDPAQEPAKRAKTSTTPPVDREKTCPLLLRFFPRLGGHHRLQEYQKRGSEPASEFQAHTWMDATLRELSDLVKQMQPGARHRNARIEFALVFPDKSGHNIMRLIGDVHSTDPGPDDDKTLKDVRHETGDFIDVAIMLPDRGDTRDRERPRR